MRKKRKRKVKVVRVNLAKVNQARNVAEDVPWDASKTVQTEY